MGKVKKIYTVSEALVSDELIAAADDEITAAIKDASAGMVIYNAGRTTVKQLSLDGKWVPMPAGPTGPAGKDGANGKDGKDGASIESILFNTDAEGHITSGIATMTDHTTVKITVDRVTGADKIKMMTGEQVVGYGEKKANELMNDDVTIAWDGVNGTVGGTFINVTDWEELPGEPHSGHFFAMTVDQKYKGKPFTFTKDDTGESSSVEEASDAEMFWVLCIDKNKKFTFKSGEEVIAHLDFTGAKLA